MIVDLVGKHNRIRTVPMPGWAKTAIDEWLSGAGFSSGPLIRAMHKGDRILHDSMSAQSIFEIVVAYGHGIGIALAPHDLRRTFAKLAHRGRAAPCDHLGIDLERVR